MIKQFIKPPVYIFIDAENLFYTQRTLKWLISYKKLGRYFKEECGEDCKVFVYTGIDENNISQIVRIKKAGKQIIVMSTRGHISIELLELAKYIDLRKLKERIKQ